MLLPLIDAVLRPYLRRINYDARRVPHWLLPLIERYLQAYIGTRLAPNIAAAGAAGAGVRGAWWPIGTPGETVLQWLDEEMARTPRVGSLDQFRVLVITCSEAERSIFSNGVMALPRTRVRAEWMGDRLLWWTEGREQCEVAVQTPHNGVFTSLDGMGTTIHAALRLR